MSYIWRGGKTLNALAGFVSIGILLGLTALYVVRTFWTS